MSPGFRLKFVSFLQDDPRRLRLPPAGPTTVVTVPIRPIQRFRHSDSQPLEAASHSRTGESPTFNRIQLVDRTRPNGWGRPVGPNASLSQRQWLESRGGPAGFRTRRPRPCDRGCSPTRRRSGCRRNRALWPGGRVVVPLVDQLDSADRERRIDGDRLPDRTPIAGSVGPALGRRVI